MSSVLSGAVCESCKENAVIEIRDIDLSDTYRLCDECRQRLNNRTLRPLEFFNLVAIHGETKELHDDLYDYESGEALQPDCDVQAPENYPFPVLEDLHDDLEKLIDFACVEYFTSDEVIDLIADFDKQQILTYLVKKVNYNRNINYKCYEIAAKVLRWYAGDWVREQWSKHKQGELLIFSEVLATCLPSEEAFAIITKELASLQGNDFSQQSLSLCELKTNSTLAWIEENQRKIVNVSDSWGTIAAISQFDWTTAKDWLEKGRPLSLIALDALYYCTGAPQDNWPIMLRKEPPTLIDSPAPTIVLTTLANYSEIDNVPRVKSLYSNIVANLSKRNKL